MKSLCSLAVARSWSSLKKKNLGGERKEMSKLFLVKNQASMCSNGELRVNRLVELLHTHAHFIVLQTWSDPSRFEEKKEYQSKFNMYTYASTEEWRDALPKRCWTQMPSSANETLKPKENSIKSNHFCQKLDGDRSDAIVPLWSTDSIGFLTKNGWKRITKFVDVNAHTRAHKHTYAHAHARAHTQIHTHTMRVWCSLGSCQYNDTEPKHGTKSECWRLPAGLLIL